jgi:hypothetical protein
VRLGRLSKTENPSFGAAAENIQLLALEIKEGILK